MTEVRYRCRRGCPDGMMPRYRPGRYERECPICHGMLDPFVDREADLFALAAERSYDYWIEMRPAPVDAEALADIFRQIDEMRRARRFG